TTDPGRARDEDRRSCPRAADRGRGPALAVWADVGRAVEDPAARGPVRARRGRLVARPGARCPAGRRVERPDGTRAGHHDRQRWAARGIRSTSRRRRPGLVSARSAPGSGLPRASRRQPDDQNIDVETGQLGRQEWEPLVPSLLRSVLDGDVLPVDVAQLAELLLERLPEWAAEPARVQHSYQGSLGCKCERLLLGSAA